MSAMQALTRAAAQVALKAKTQSPNIAFGAGLIGVVGGGIMACKATLKLPMTIEEATADLQRVKEARNTEGTKLSRASEPEYRGVQARAYGAVAARFVKLYGPAVLVAGVGVALLTGSHVQLLRRNATLQAALVSIQAAFENYRNRMKEELGVERENAIWRNVDGLKLDKDPVDDRDPNAYSVYARIFDESNPNWSKDPERNKVFLQMRQNYCNHLLNSRHFLFLNEVYDALGFEMTPEGAVSGWALGGDDNHVDFGVIDVRNARFVNAEERSVWLEFNVNGVILDRI